MRYKYQLSFLVILLKIHWSLADSSVEDYAFLAQQKMQHDIKIAGIQTTYVKDSYNDMVAIIVDRQQKVNEEIHQADAQLTLMQAVNSNYRQCIQRHKSGMYTQDQAEAKFSACLNAAKTKSEKLMIDVETPMNFAKQTANVKLPMAVESCQHLTSNNDTVQGECVVDKVETQSKTFDEDLDNVQDGLEVNLGISSLVARNAMECSFEAEKEILVKIGSSLQLIDVCLENNQLPVKSVIKMMYN